MSAPLPGSPSYQPCRIKKIQNLLYVSIIGCLQIQCLPYLYHLGKEQSKIIWNRENIERSLENPAYDEKTKKKLKLIREVREFAITKLALSKKGGFEYFTKLERDAIGWNVSASKPLAFESYTWWFPIAGSVPYKGYFDKNLALEMEEELKKEGYDTRIREIGGYSTLGWFSDPVLSPQLSWPNHRLVGLVIHEMAHATAYLPGDSDLNESYATFVEEKGVEIFYSETNFKNQEELNLFKTEKEKKRKGLELLKKYAKLLDETYKEDIPDFKKLERKSDLIQKFKMEVFERKLIPFDKYQEFLKRDWNNEDFLGALRYNSGETSFESIFQSCNGNFSKFHEGVKDIFKLSAEERKLFLSKSSEPNLQR